MTGTTFLDKTSPYSSCSALITGQNYVANEPYNHPKANYANNNLATESNRYHNNQTLYETINDKKDTNDQNKEYTQVRNPTKATNSEQTNGQVFFTTSVNIYTINTSFNCLYKRQVPNIHRTTSTQVNGNTKRTKTVHYKYPNNPTNIAKVK